MANIPNFVAQLMGEDSPLALATYKRGRAEKQAERDNEFKKALMLQELRQKAEQLAETKRSNMADEAYKREDLQFRRGSEALRIAERGEDKERDDLYRTQQLELENRKLSVMAANYSANQALARAQFEATQNYRETNMRLRKEIAEIQAAGRSQPKPKVLQLKNDQVEMIRKSIVDNTDFRYDYKKKQWTNGQGGEELLNAIAWDATTRMNAMLKAGENAPINAIINSSLQKVLKGAIGSDPNIGSIVSSKMGFGEPVFRISPRLSAVMGGDLQDYVAEAMSIHGDNIPQEIMDNVLDMSGMDGGFEVNNEMQY